ncbi:MAG: hypothetical protein U1F59_01885 [Candidatus Competibacteraceae bacterium]
MTDHFLPDYGLYLLDKGVRPETRLMFFDLPVAHLTRPDPRTVCLTLSIEEGSQDYAISFDFIGPRVEELLAIFPEPQQEAIWRWLEDRYTVGEHLALSPPATVFSLEATLGAAQQGIYERFAPLIVRRVTARPSGPGTRRPGG